MRITALLRQGTTLRPRQTEGAVTGSITIYRKAPPAIESVMVTRRDRVLLRVHDGTQMLRPMHLTARLTVTEAF